MSCKLLYVLAGLLAASATVQGQIIGGLLQEVNVIVDDVSSLAVQLVDSASEVTQEVVQDVIDLDQQLETVQIAMDAMGPVGVYGMVQQFPQLPTQLGAIADQTDALITSLQNSSSTLQGEQKALADQAMETLQQMNQRAQQMKQTIDSAIQTFS